MGISETLRERARELRELAKNPEAANIKELLHHLAHECERIAAEHAAKARS